jgi:hypothetical protein
MRRFYYSDYGPFFEQFIALKRSLGYKYRDPQYVLVNLISSYYQERSLRLEYQRNSQMPGAKNDRMNLLKRDTPEYKR